MNEMNFRNVNRINIDNMRHNRGKIWFGLLDATHCQHVAYCLFNNNEQEC